MSALTLLSRIFGFVRDLLVAKLFGATMLADAFYVAFRVPNLLRSLVAEGALSAAFVPLLSARLVKGHSEAKQALREVAGFLLVATAVLSALGILYAPEIISVLAPGFLNNPGKTDVCIKLTRIMMPYILFVSMVAMLNGALNSVKIFGAAAWAQVLMNITLIVGALLAALFNGVHAVEVLSWSVIVGGIVQVIAQFPALKRAGFLIWPHFRLFSSNISELLRLMLPAIFGATVYQLSIFINTLFASLLPDGSVSWLFYADRLTQLPIGIFSIALASVLLPALSHAAAKEDHHEFSSHLVDSLRYTSFIIIPLSALIFHFAEPLIAVMFERGAFTEHDSQMTAVAVCALSLGLWSASCQSLVARAFMARRSTWVPTFVGIGSLAVGAPLALMLMGPAQTNDSSNLAAFVYYVQSALPSMQFDLRHAGLGIASSLASLIAFILLLKILTSKIALNLSAFVACTIKTLLASILTIWALRALELKGQTHFLLLAHGAIGSAAILGMLYLFRSLELKEVLVLCNRLFHKQR